MARNNIHRITHGFDLFILGDGLQIGHFQILFPDSVPPVKSVGCAAADLVAGISAARSSAIRRDA